MGCIVNHRCSFFSSIVVSILMVALFATLVGCGAGILVGGEVQQFSGDYTITLENPKTGILDVIADMGKSMGYRVSSRSAGSIGLGSEASFLDRQVGKIKANTIMVRPGNGGRVLHIHITVTGTFSEGTQENADKLFNDFKTKLLQELK